MPGAQSPKNATGAVLARSGAASGVDESGSIKIRPPVLSRANGSAPSRRSMLSKTATLRPTRLSLLLSSGLGDTLMRR